MSKKKTSSCTQVNLILNSINPQVERLNQYSRIYGFSNLTKEQNILKDQIYINLNWISKEIEITNSICGKTEQKNSNIKTTNTKKIVTSDFGINLGKIQSDINVKRNFLEKCANYCITFGHKDVNCVAYNEYSEKTSSDYEDYITLVNKHGLQAFTNQEQSVILLIDREVKACSEYINLIRKKCENNN